MANPADPWSWDAFGDSPANDGFAPPPVAPRARRRIRRIPEQDDLFSVQKHLLKALDSLFELESEILEIDDGNRRKEMETLHRRARHETSDAYKLIRNFLVKYAQ